MAKPPPNGSALSAATRFDCEGHPSSGDDCYGLNITHNAHSKFREDTRDLSAGRLPKPAPVLLALRCAAVVDFDQANSGAHIQSPE